MATSKIVTTGTWQLAAASEEQFIIDNASSYPVQVTFSIAAPAVDAAYHTLAAKEAIVRMGLTGGVYVRDVTGDIGAAFVVVTV
jgi:hypothetical protein